MALIHVFDLGNVLLFVNERLFFEKVRPRCRRDIDLEAVFSDRYERARVDRGGDFTRFYEEIAPTIDLQMELDEFRETWNDIFDPNPPMLDVVRQTPRPRYLLSNTNEPHVKWISERYADILSLFDGCVLSNEVGVRKPDAGIYRHVESLSGQPSERHVFVDDVPAFVEGARAVGWRAILFQGVEDYLNRVREFETKN